MKERIYRSLIELTNGPVTSAALRKFAVSRLSRPLIKPYARIYRINQDEMHDALHHYSTLHAFFTRRLKDGTRPIDETPYSIISPVDGVLEDWGTITSNRELVIKGKSYSVEEMLGGKEAAETYSGGTYMILYLSPAHYHRIHSPINGTVVRTYSLGKKSFPVNKAGLKYGTATLAKNFRTITELKHGKRRIAMVKVGAMFINTVEVTNKNKEWKKGEEAAYFSFGSTVILLFEKSAFNIHSELDVPKEIKMGEPLGTLTP